MCVVLPGGVIRLRVVTTGENVSPIVVRFGEPGGAASPLESTAGPVRRRAASMPSLAKEYRDTTPCPPMVCGNGRLGPTPGLIRLERPMCGTSAEEGVA